MVGMVGMVWGWLPGNSALAECCPVKWFNTPYSSGTLFSVQGRVLAL